MTAYVDKRQTTAEGNDECYHQQASAQQTLFYMLPHEPTENRPKKHPANCMPTWISLISSCYMKSEWRGCTDKCTVNKPGWSGWSFHHMPSTSFTSRESGL